MSKMEIPWLKSDVGAGDALKSLLDFVIGPNKTYCQTCDRRRTALNGLFTFSAPQPPAQSQRPQNVPIERPPTDDQ